MRYIIRIMVMIGFIFVCHTLKAQRNCIYQTIIQNEILANLRSDPKSIDIIRSCKKGEVVYVLDVEIENNYYLVQVGGQIGYITKNCLAKQYEGQPIPNANNKILNFKIKDSWTLALSLCQQHFSNLYSLDKHAEIIHIQKGIFSPLQTTEVNFLNEKIYSISSYYQQTIPYTRTANIHEVRAGISGFVSKNQNELQQEYNRKCNIASQKFKECYAKLIALYGQPYQITDANEAIWMTNKLIIRLYPYEGEDENGISLKVIVSYEENIYTEQPSNNSNEYLASGSGFVLTNNGIIVTNYHVVKDMSIINVQLKMEGDIKSYNAKLISSDKMNDIALIKIEDPSFQNFHAIPYAINFSTCDVGTSVFAMGYPMSNQLGEEVKVTDGIISSKTGYQGDVVTYQISAPIQPGNSGGPLFDKQGNLVGITNAGVPEANNVGYAIKTSYLKSLVDALPFSVYLPSNNTISMLSFVDKIKKLSEYVVFIKVK